METVSSEMYKLGWKEAELRTRLLRHTAGVLGLAMRKKEEEEARVQQTPLPGSNNGAFSPNLASASGRTSQLSDRATPLSPASRFEGRHFFAGNKDAIAPTSRGAGASSPISSPRLGAAINGSSFGGAHAHFDDGSAAKVRELEAKVTELQAALQAAREGEAAELDKLREELGAAHRRESGSREEAKVSRREAIEGKRELSELRREVEVLRDDLKYAKEAGEKGKRELEEARAEVDSVKNYGGEVKRDIEEARGREEEAKEEIERVKQEVSMAERRLNEAEAKVAELEDELERVREEGDDEIRRLQDELEVAATSSRAPADEETEGGRQARADLATAHEQHAAITQVVGDVLHRHRTRQPVLRDLPSFDDSADPADLATHLSSTLDSHFDRLNSHINDLSTELDSTRADHETVRNDLETVRNDLETDLREASQHRDRFRAEAQEHRGAKEELERAHEELQHRVGEQEEQLASLSGVQSDLAGKVVEEGRLRQELSAVKMTLNGVQAQLSELGEEREGHKARAETAEKEAASKKEEAERLEQQVSLRCVERGAQMRQADPFPHPRRSRTSRSGWPSRQIRRSPCSSASTSTSRLVRATQAFR